VVKLSYYVTKKFRKHKYKKLASLVKLLSLAEQKPQIKEALITVRDSFSLTETDRVTWIYKKNKQNTIKEVTCVSYDILIRDNWLTIIYYDSYHGGILHRHMRITIDEASDIVSEIGVKKKGSPNRLLTWAMKELRDRYYEYRRNFIKKNRQKIKELGIDLY